MKKANIAVGIYNFFTATELDRLIEDLSASYASAFTTEEKSSIKADIEYYEKERAFAGAY